MLTSASISIFSQLELLLNSDFKAQSGGFPEDSLPCCLGELLGVSPTLSCTHVLLSRISKLSLTPVFST